MRIIKDPKTKNNLVLDSAFASFLEEQGYKLTPKYLFFNKYAFIKKRKKLSLDPIHRLFCVYHHYFGAPTDAFSFKIENNESFYSIGAKELFKKGDKNKFFGKIPEASSFLIPDEKEIEEPYFLRATALDFIYFIFPEMTESNVLSTFTDENQSHQRKIKTSSGNLFKEEFKRRVFNRLERKHSAFQIDYNKIKEKAKKELEELLDFCSKNPYTVSHQLSLNRYNALKIFIDTYKMLEEEK